MIQTRLDNFVVGLTNNDPATTAPVDKSSYRLYTICARSVQRLSDSRYNDSIRPYRHLCAAVFSELSLYVVVHSSPTTDRGALCIAEVSVYGRSNNLVFSKPNYQISIQMATRWQAALLTGDLTQIRAIEM